MDRDLKIFQKIFRYYRAVEYIKRKNIIGTIIQIIKCPYILIYFANKLITVLESKILAISTTKEKKYIGLTLD